MIPIDGITLFFNKYDLIDVDKISLINPKG